MTVETTTPSALTLARLLGKGKLARVALAAALDALDGPAFIVSARGTPLHANASGARKLASNGDDDGDGDRLRRSLAAAAKDGSDPARTALVTPLRGETGPTYFLVVFPRRSSAAATAAYATSLWELTPRQSDVLTMLLEGFTNKTIALRLGCAERTVETHLTAIFQKSGFDSRSALLAALARL
ncbi:MAG: LuxR family transcriptional regulator [Labilithrix sp.]|nr:LuxR family transcriptional regulator [Labilithrix sp.]MCW5813790.1 LuxR family transcriptional regulator [Labilithrix sp.]